MPAYRGRRHCHASTIRRTLAEEKGNIEEDETMFLRIEGDDDV